MTTIKAMDATAMIDNPTIVIQTIGATIAHDSTTRMLGATNPTTRRMITSTITVLFVKRRQLVWKKESISFQITFGSWSWSCSCSSSRSCNNHHVDQEDRKPSAAPKHGYSPKHGYLYSSKSDDGGHIHCPDKSNTVF
jgi:hypothetical protein